MGTLVQQRNITRMGANISSEQAENLRSGRAIYNDRYVEFPEGCAGKAIWGTRRTETGWKEAQKFFQKEEMIDVPTLAVEQLMEQRGCSSLYQEFMRAVYSAMEGTYFWRSRVLSERKRFAPLFAAHALDVWVCSDHASSYGHDEFFLFFADTAVASHSTVESFRWWYVLWGQRDKESHTIGRGCTGPEGVTLLSADFSKAVTA